MTELQLSRNRTTVEPSNEKSSMSTINNSEYEIFDKTPSKLKLNKLVK